VYVQAHLMTQMKRPKYEKHERIKQRRKNNRRGGGNCGTQRMEIDHLSQGKGEVWGEHTRSGFAEKSPLRKTGKGVKTLMKQ